MVLVVLLVEIVFFGRVGLGSVERGVGLLEYLVVSLFEAPVDSDTDADADILIRTGDLDALQSTFEDGFGNPAGNLRIVRILNEYNEFIASETSRDLSVHELFAEELSELQDDVIAHIVAICIVDLLEMIDVHNEQESLIGRLVI